MLGRNISLPCAVLAACQAHCYSNGHTSGARVKLEYVKRPTTDRWYAERRLHALPSSPLMSRRLPPESRSRNYGLAQHQPCSDQDIHEQVARYSLVGYNQSGF